MATSALAQHHLLIPVATMLLMAIIMFSVLLVAKRGGYLEPAPPSTPSRPKRTTRRPSTVSEAEATPVPRSKSKSPSRAKSPASTRRRKSADGSAPPTPKAAQKKAAAEAATAAAATPRRTSARTPRKPDLSIASEAPRATSRGRSQRRSAAAAELQPAAVLAQE